MRERPVAAVGRIKSQGYYATVFSLLVSVFLKPVLPLDCGSSFVLQETCASFFPWPQARQARSCQNKHNHSPLAALACPTSLHPPPSIILGTVFSAQQVGEESAAASLWVLFLAYWLLCSISFSGHSNTSRIFYSTHTQARSSCTTLTALVFGLSYLIAYSRRRSTDARRPRPQWQRPWLACLQCFGHGQTSRQVFTRS